MKESYIRLIQYMFGVIIAIVVLFHFQLFSSLIGPGYVKAQEWIEIASRMDNPFYDAIYMVLLFVMLTHGFIGIRNISFEYVMSKSGRILVSWILFLIYLIALFYGLAPIVASVL